MKLWVVGSGGRLGQTLLEKHESIGTTHAELDISNRDAVLAFADRERPTHIINTAAVTNVDLCEEDPKLAYRINSEGAGYIAEVEAKLLHISTDYVFAGDRTESYSEEDPTEPVNIYGKSKLEGEQRVLENNPQSCIVRASWYFGRGDKDFIATMLRLMKERDEVQVVSDVKSRPTYYNDLADAILKLLDQEGIFHFANQGAVSRYEMAMELHQRVNVRCKEVVPVTSDTFPARAPRPHSSILSTEKIESLGIVPRPWTEALEEYLQCDV